MLAANGAMTLNEHGHHHAFDAQVIEKNGSRNHIHNRIDGAHLVKMHFAYGKAVGFRLSLTQYGERLCGERPCSGRHAGGRDQGIDFCKAAVLVTMDMGAAGVMAVVVVGVHVRTVVVMNMTARRLVGVRMLVVAVMGITARRLMVVRMLVVAVMGMPAGMLGPMQVGHVVIVILVLGIEMHGKVEAGQPCLRHARDLDGKALNLQTVERIHHRGLRALTIGRNVEQSRHQHIARDARLAVEPQRRSTTHAYLFFPGR